jgi:hypothetical protein
VTWLAVGLAVGLATGATLMTWWSSKRLEREAARRYEIGIAEGVQIAERERKRKRGRSTAAAADSQRRRKALQRVGRADDAVA